jgi:hypothetical protein
LSNPLKLSGEFVLSKTNPLPRTFVCCDCGKLVLLSCDVLVTRSTAPWTADVDAQFVVSVESMQGRFVVVRRVPVVIRLAAHPG